MPDADTGSAASTSCGRADYWAGNTTVLIGKLPAAVVGDMAVCVGPPDTIVKGSATVMIGGKPAARMGDTTAHGGSIVVGCPNVIIGG